MNKAKRTAGRKLRAIAKLDRQWRAAGRQEGRVENRLAFELGQAARMGLGRESRRIQCRVAREMGQRSGWEGQA